MNKQYWGLFRELEQDFYVNLAILETRRSKKVSTKNLELFWCDNEAVGIGNLDRNLELITREDLKENE